MSDAQKQALFDNTAAAMGDAPDFIKYRHIRNCHRCDPAYGEGVAKALGLTVEDAQAARATTRHWVSRVCCKWEELCG